MQWHAWLHVMVETRALYNPLLTSQSQFERERRSTPRHIKGWKDKKIFTQSCYHPYKNLGF